MQKMKNSGIEWMGEIPEDWDTMRIQFCLDEIVVKNDPIQTTQVLSLMKDKGVMLYEEKGDVGNKAKEDCREYKIAYSNTLIVNSMNILIGSVGISNYFGCVSPVYYVFKETSIADLRYINYIFNTAAFQKELRRYANGILEIRLRVSANDIFKREIPLPPKSLQTKIADFLDEKCAKIDTLIAHEQATIEELKAYKQSVITEAVTKGLDKSVPMKDSGIDWVGEIPIQWNIVRNKDLFSYRNERNFEALENVNLISLYTDLGVVQHADVEHTTGNKAVTADGYKIVKENDIVVNIILCWMGAIGRSAFNGVTSPAYDIYAPKRGTNSRFYNYYFRTKGFNGECFKYGRGIMLMRWRTYSDEFRAIQVVKPPINEQEKIADYLDKKSADIDSLISIKQQKIEELKEYKKSLIYEYVTGKKEVA